MHACRCQSVGDEDTVIHLICIMQELLSKALTLDTGVEASKVQSLISVEEACLFDAGRTSIKAVEAWRYAQLMCSLLQRVPQNAEGIYKSFLSQPSFHPVPYCSM